MLFSAVEIQLGQLIQKGVKGIFRGLFGHVIQGPISINSGKKRKHSRQEISHCNRHSKLGPTKYERGMSNWDVL
jgi:hypothetical protein